MQNLFAVFSVRIGYMNPSVVTFVNELVKREIPRHNHLEQLPVSLRAPGCDVGCLSFHVLRGGGTAHGPVQHRTTESAVHRDRATPTLPYRIETPIDQLLQFKPNG